MKMKKILAVVLAGVMALSMTACGKSAEYESILEDFFKAIEEADGELYMSLVHSTVLENERENYNLTEESQKEMYQTFIKTLHDTMVSEYGDDFEFSYKIEEDEELKGDDIEKYEEKLESIWGEEDVKITKAYESEVELTIKVGGEKEKDTADFVFAEVDNEWCIVESDM